MKNKTQRAKLPFGLIFVGCMFIGMGLGQLLGATSVGMFIGMGVGFLAQAFVKFNNKPQHSVNIHNEE